MNLYKLVQICLKLFLFKFWYKIYSFTVRVGEYNVLDEKETHDHANRRITRVITHVNFDKVHINSIYLHKYMITPSAYMIWKYFLSMSELVQTCLKCSGWELKTWSCQCCLAKTVYM